MTKPLPEQPVSSTLGFSLMISFTWSNHIAYLEKELSCSVGIFYQICQCASDSAIVICKLLLVLGVVLA